MDLMKDIDELAKDFTPADEVEEKSYTMAMLRTMTAAEKEPIENAETPVEVADDSIMSVMKAARDDMGWK